MFLHNQSNLRRDLTDDNLARTYASMCDRGDVGKALRWLTDRDGGTGLSPDDIDPKSNKSVKEVLNDKHPPLWDVLPHLLEEYGTLPELPDTIITREVDEKVA